MRAYLPTALLQNPQPTAPLFTTPNARPGSLQMAACHLGAPDADAPGASGSKASHPLLPFVLIQGPPGTGKTHTVKVGRCILLVGPCRLACTACVAPWQASCHPANSSNPSCTHRRAC